jgi:hypothetical protein
MAPVRSKKAQPSVDTWLSDPQDLPRADIDLRDKQASRQKLFRGLIFTVLFGLFPISMLANMAMMPKLLEARPVLEAPAAQLNPETKAAAMLEVKNWLAHEPSPLPGGSLLSWDGAEIQAEPSITVNKDTNQTEEVQGLQLHTMTVASTTGAVFTTTVQVAYSPVRGAKVVGTPTLVPKAPNDSSQWPNLTTWPGYTKVTTTDAVTQSATAWVEAFTSGNPDKLRLAVGDTAVNHSYVPLSQAIASDVRVVEVAARKSADTGSEEKAPSQVIARVSFAIKWVGQDVGRATVLSRVTYDVLIERAETNAPIVVAWGGTGTGASLKPYGNAVERKLTTDSIPDSVETKAPDAPAAPAAIPTVGALVPPAPPTTGK